MVEKFLEYSKANSLPTDTNRIVVAVSGGIDSMVLAHLYLESGIKPAIAHCNFSLRGAESDSDEDFVRDFADRNNLVFHTIRFQTTDYASSNGLSIQMAARDLRYNWFEEIRSKNGYEAVAVAHNLNDNAETFFINLIRGTGISGLTGMKPRNENIIRPLLFATRDEIVTYASGKNIAYREDSSNAQVKYVRNKIRHNILPVFKEINPDVLSSITYTIEHLSGSAEIINNAVDDIRNKLFRVSDIGISVSIEKLKLLRPEKSYLFELFRPYGLSPHQTGEISDLVRGNVGKLLYTNSHRIIRDRNDLIITSITLEPVSTNVFKSFKELNESHVFSSVIIADASTVKPEANPYKAFIDADLITYPLTYRLWEQGDRFSPLGMKGMKKISDFLVDNKISRVAKERIKVLVSGQSIIWVAGHRLDNNFRVTENTTSIMIISL